MERIKVGLVEDQNLFREGIKALINKDDRLSVVFESPDGYSLLERLQHADEIPDVMLIDLSLPPDGKKEYSGWKVLSVLIDAYPEMKKLILSVNNDPYVIANIIEKGANGYLIKDADAKEVQDGIVIAHEKGSYINQQALEALLQRSSGKEQKFSGIKNNISERELDVLQLLSRGMTTQEIASKLFISEKTVNGHRYNLLQKTGAKNAAGLVMYAVKHGLVEIS